MPKLTIAVPTFNRANMLVKMLDSILAQTYTDFKVIISDNCSSDNTSDVIQTYLRDARFSYIKRDSIRKDHFNVLIKECSTEYLLIAHDDDIMLPQMVEKEIEALETHKDCILVSTNVNYINDADDFIGATSLSSMMNADYIIQNRELISLMINKDYWIACPTVMFRVVALRTHNIYFREGIGGACDVFFWLELNQLGYKFYFLYEPLYNYRKHGGQDSHLSPILLPFIKKPVYELLKNHNYSNSIINEWIKYINKMILYEIWEHLKYRKKYFVSRKLFFQNNITEICFRVKFYIIIYVPITIKMYKKGKAILRKLPYRKLVK